MFLAEHQAIEKRVALKTLRREYGAKPELVKRFQQEAISASRIKHPNVLDIFDFGQLEDGTFFLAMEYLQGHDLATELSKHGTLDPVRGVRIALQMVRALAAAHARGVVHRDMKPENVFLHMTEDGDEIVKIVDFGIAQLRSRDEMENREPRRRRLTRTGMIFGTPEYMSPEQAAGRRADIRVDVYAVGVILYESFTGAVPFTGDSFMAVLGAHLTQPVPPMRAFVPDLPISAALEDVVMRSLAKDPNQRFPSMREVAAALQSTPEGRVAVPMAGLLPIPEVTALSFRPARGPTETTPQFQGPAPIPRLVLDESRSPSVPTRIEADANPSPAPATLEVVAPAPRRQNRAMVAGVLAVLVIGGGTVAALYLDGNGAWHRTIGARMTSESLSAAAATPSSTAAPAASPTTPSGPEISPVAAATVSLPPPVERVSLRVETQPPGAVLTQDGFQVCDKTPCTLSANRDAALELSATLGAARGSARVLAQTDQTVTIALVAPRSGSRRPGPKKPKLCEVVLDGLKILRPCP